MSNKLPSLKIRKYGSTGPFVTVLHGGPGAPGYMAPVCARLASQYNVIEPFQRRSGGEKLTVKRHVEDLYELVNCHCNGNTAIVGHSWGAMLGLAFAAEYPDCVSCLIIIGCSTFDKESRRVMEEIRNSRKTEEISKRLANLETEYTDPDKRLGAFGRIFQLIDSYDLIIKNSREFSCDAVGHEETWNDMMRLQDENVYPSKFSNITCPTIMMHGTYDPHPGKMIETVLRKYIRQLEYMEWENCGHYPWLEKRARASFYQALFAWIKENTRKNRQ